MASSFAGRVALALPGDGVQLSGSFQEHLADGISSLRLVANFRSNLTLQDIGDRDARMAMGRGAFTRPVGNFDCRGRPALQG